MADAGVMITWEQEMATWEQDQKFKRDTIMEIDREYGKAQERERIVAIIVEEIAAHTIEQAKYKDGEANREAWNMEESAIYALQDLLTKVRA